MIAAASTSRFRLRTPLRAQAIVMAQFADGVAATARQIFSHWEGSKNERLCPCHCAERKPTPTNHVPRSVSAVGSALFAGIRSDRKFLEDE